MSDYGWVIDKDHIGGNDVGKVGPSSISKHNKARLELGLGFKWRAYDDDDELYYEGRCLGEDDSNGLGPLTDFCQPNAGCTRIEFFEGDGWVML